MGMLFARRRTPKSKKVTTSNILLGKQPKNVENVQPKKDNNIPTQPKFKV